MTVTVTATVEPGWTPPRVRLDVAASAGEAFATVTRSDPDGHTVPVRTEDGGPLLVSGGAALIYDYEMPYGQSVTYSSLESPSAFSAQVTVDESRAWLIHVGVPALSQPITVQALEERSATVTRGVYRPLGAEFPVVHTDGQRKAAEYTLGLYTGTDLQRADLSALLSDAGVLLLNVPAGKGWGLGAEYVSVGDVSERRVTRFLGEPARIWSLPITVVDRPVGGSQAQRTLADLLAYSTLGDLQAVYPTLLDVLAGP